MKTVREFFAARHRAAKVQQFRDAQTKYVQAALALDIHDTYLPGDIASATRDALLGAREVARAQLEAIAASFPRHSGATPLEHRQPYAPVFDFTKRRRW